MKKFRNLALALGLFLTGSCCVTSLSACDDTENTGSSSSSQNSSVEKPDENEGTDNKKEPIEITVGVSKNEAERAVAGALKTAFESKYGADTYTVKIVEMDGEYNNTLLRMQRRGELPDICVAYDTSADYWSARGVFIPLESYAVRDGIKAENFTPSAVYHTAQAWIPTSVEKRVVYINKNAIKKASADYVAKDTWSWSQITALAQTVTTSETVHPIKLTLTDPSVYTAFFQNHGVALGENGTAFDGAETDVCKALAALSSLAQSGLLADEEATVENTAVWVGTRADLPAYTNAGVDFDIVPMPSADNGNAYAGYTVSGFAITEDCPSAEREAAWNFIKYAVSEAGQSVAGNTGYTVPVLKTLTEQADAEWRKFAETVNNEAFLVNGAQDIGGAFLRDSFAQERQPVAYSAYGEFVQKACAEKLAETGNAQALYEEYRDILAPKYELDTYLLPVWEGKTVHYETAMIVGEKGEVTLYDTPETVLGVYDYGLQRKYVEGVDYTLDKNVIKRIAGGNMPYATFTEVYSDEAGQWAIPVEPSRCPDYDYDGGTEYLAYGETDTFTRRQIAITYTRANGWQGEKPQGKRERFANLNAKLEAGEAVNMVVYGDSISTGCNSSGTALGGNVAPYAESFPDMIKNKLQKDYGSEVTLRNVAKGGEATAWAVANLEERVLSEDADLLILGFGMNDLTTPVDTYRQRTEEMITKFRQRNPKGEVVLVAPMLPNIESTWLKNQPLFAEELYQLEAQYSYVAVADMTAIHWDMLATGKRYRDMTANNINHPNDFMARVYGQVILHTLVSSEK